MILTCPSCSTRFVVPPAAIGPDGRRVRCAQCKEMWFVEPPEEELEIVPEVVIAESALEDDPIPDFSNTTSDKAEDTADDAEDSTDDGAADSGGETATEPDAVPAPDTEGLANAEDAAEDAADEQPAEPPEEPAADEEAVDPEQDAVAARRARRLELKTVRSNLPALPRSRSRALVAGWMAYAAVMLALVLTPVFARAWVSEIWPPITHLYSLLGAEDLNEGASDTSTGSVDDSGPHPRDFMAFDYPISTSKKNGITTLTINGVARNNGTRIVVLPEFRGTLLDSSGSELYVWTFSVGGMSVAPGGEATFQTTVSPMPEETVRMDVLPLWPE